MRKKIVFLICLICAGTFAYYGGYHLYRNTHPKVEIIEPENLMQAVTVEKKTVSISREYYIGVIKEDMLMIYQMPEETLYDSIAVSSLKFYGDELQQLREGMIFKDLAELFGFLENSMS